MRRYIFVVTFFALSVLYGASVEAKVSQESIVQGETMRLDIIAEGKRAAFEKIDAINDALVLNSRVSSENSIIIINSKKQIKKKTILSLFFRPKHDMTIPSFSVNVDGKELHTKPIEIKVLKPSLSPSAIMSGPISATLKIPHSHIYEGQSTVATVVLGIRKDIKVTQMRIASFDANTMLLKQGEQRRYRNGEYIIYEIDYKLTPQMQGSYSIGPVVVDVQVVDSNRRDIFGMFSRTKVTEVQSDTKEVKVEPKPDGVDLVGNFQLSVNLDRNKTSANEPVNLTVTIQGEGDLEDFDLEKYNIDGVTCYSDEPKVKSRFDAKSIFSKWQKSFALIGDKSFSIPKREIKVFNPETNSTKILTIKGFNISIPHSISQQKENSTVEVHTSKQADTEPKAKHQDLRYLFSWIYLALALLLGIVLGYSMPLLLKKIRKERFDGSYEKALKRLYPHISESQEVEHMVRELYKKISKDKSVKIDKKELKRVLQKYAS